MKSNNRKLRLSSKCMVIGAGSRGVYICKGLRTMEEKNGIPAHQRAKVIAYDAQGVSHHWSMPTVDKRFEDVSLSRSEMVRGIIPDKESRKFIEKQGRIYMAEPEWVEDPGPAAQNPGAGGDMRAGRCTFALTSTTFASKVCSTLREINEYDQQHNSGADGTIETQPIVDVFVSASLCGGTGSAAFASITNTVNREAAILNMKVRVTQIFLLVGSLNPGDRKTTSRNQQLALKSLKVHYEGKFRSLTEQNPDHHYFSNPPIFLSNLNDFGEIPTLRQLTALASKFVKLVNYTGFGDEFRQEIINLHEGVTTDRLGRPKTAATFGLASIHLNRAKILMHSVAKKVLLWTKEMLKQYKDPEPARQALNDANDLAVIESATENSATERLYRLHAMGNIDAHVRASNVFRSRWTHHYGVQGCKSLYDAADYTFNIEIPKQLSAAIEKEANNWFDKITIRIKYRGAEYLKTIKGPSHCEQYLDTFRTVISGSQTSNQEKLANTMRSGKGIKAATARYKKLYDRLKRRNWLWRLLSFITVFVFLRKYPRYVEMRIRNELELVARKILSKHYSVIQKVLEDERKVTDEIRQNLTDFSVTVEDECSRLYNLSDELDVPVGIKLDTPKFMDKVFDDIVEFHGGEANVVRLLFSAFLDNYKSLEIFLKNDVHAIHRDMVDYAKELARPVVSRLHVLNVFKETFKTEQEQREQSYNRVKESCGRLITTGQADQDIPSLKCIIGPDKFTCDYFRSIANNVTRLGGDWGTSVCEGLDEIVFFWYRGGVSISALIEDTYKLAPPIKDPKVLVKMGEDPVIMTAPDYNGSYDDIDRTIVEGLVAKLITRNKDIYILNGSKIPIRLGTNLDEIRATLAANCSLLIGIHRDFAVKLAIQKELLLENIERMVDSGNGDELIASLTLKPINEAKQIGDFLLLYLSRLYVEG